MHNNDNQSQTMWLIWTLLSSLFLIILISSVIFFVFWYRKQNKKFLTTKKIVLLSTYMSFFLLQTFIFSPLVNLPIPFSFDSITTIAIGFIFGPLEGIMFGWVADSLRVFMNGWSYAILPSLLYPTIGLVAGIMGLLYKGRDKVNIWVSISIFQTIIFLILVTLVIVGAFSPLVLPKTISKKIQITTFVFSITLFIILEIIFIVIIRGENPGTDILLISMLILVAFFDRLIELIIRPFTQYFSGKEKYYTVALITRVLSSTYLIPTVTITSFIMIKTSYYVMSL